MPELSPSGFQKLLSFLDADLERAGERYEDLRRRLLIFFEGRQCGHASEVLADRTIDVVAAKLSDGLELASSFIDVLRYSLAVARNVLKDHAKRPRTDPLTTDPAAAPEFDVPGDNARIQCLEHCLGTLAPESRRLILDFYVGERRTKIDNRARMAEDLDITPNALRRRTHMIRMRLETCVRECVESGAAR